MSAPTIEPSDARAIPLEAPLQGYVWVETVKRAFLPAIISYDEGKGHVGALLARLMDEYDEVIVPGVMSARLEGMLQRRGFHEEEHYSAAFGEYVGCWVWNKKAAEFTASMEATAAPGTGASDPESDPGVRVAETNT